MQSPAGIAGGDQGMMAIPGRAEEGMVAIFDWSLQTVQRSAGGSAVAMAAYRSGNCLRDHRTGVEHDFTRRRDIHAEIVMPEDVTAPALDNPNSRSELRSRLWNAAEAAEGRKNSVTAREILVALPHELPRDQQLTLARAYAGHIARRFGVVVDVAVHPPSRTGDRRNWHCHMLFTTRRVGSGFAFGPKTRELDAASTGGPIIKHLREKWADFVNLMLMDLGSSAAIDHRSLADRGIMRAPDRHIGPQRTNLARKLRGKAARLVKEAADLEQEALTVLWPRPALAEIIGEPVEWERTWVAHARVVEQAAREAAARAKALEESKPLAPPAKTAAQTKSTRPVIFDIDIIDEGEVAPIIHRDRPRASNAASPARVVDPPVVRPVLPISSVVANDVGSGTAPASLSTSNSLPRPAKLTVTVMDEGDLDGDRLAAAIRTAAMKPVQEEREEDHLVSRRIEKPLSSLELPLHGPPLVEAADDRSGQSPTSTWADAASGEPLRMQLKGSVEPQKAVAKKRVMRPAPRRSRDVEDPGEW